MTAGGTCPPSEAEIGSPGATRISRNSIVSRISTIGTTSASRVSAYDLSEVPEEELIRKRRCRDARLRGHPGAGTRSLLVDQPEPHDEARIERGGRPPYPRH